MWGREARPPQVARWMGSGCVRSQHLKLQAATGSIIFESVAFPGILSLTSPCALRIKPGVSPPCPK